MIIHEDNNAVVGHWRLGFFHDFLFVFRPMVVARFSTTSIFFRRSPLCLERSHNTHTYKL